MTTLTPTSTPEAVSVSTAIDSLATRGYRITAPRQAVVEAVLAHDRPFSAEQIVADLPDHGRATVYRTLEIMASVDLLTRLLQNGPHPTYVVGAPGHRHHLVCSSCNLVVAFTACPVDDLVADLARETDFAIQGHHLEISGLCPRCQ